MMRSRGRLMSIKKIDDLETKLRSASSLEEFLSENSFPELDFYTSLRDLYYNSCDSKMVLATKTGLSYVYVCQIFLGKRKPSRDSLLRLCLGMEVELEQCQELLRRNMNSTLYVKRRRDAVIMYGILHRLGVFEVNDMLDNVGEMPLF